MAVLSKHVCEFVDRARDQQVALPQSVEVVLSTNFPTYETPVIIGAEQPCACGKTVRQTCNQVQEASNSPDLLLKDVCDIVITWVPILLPLSPPVEHS
jgi:hypothetical protein